MDSLGWVNVKDELPKKDGFYIVWTKHTGIAQANWSKKGGWFALNHPPWLMYITHWMSKSIAPEDTRNIEDNLY